MAWIAAGIGVAGALFGGSKEDKASKRAAQMADARIREGQAKVEGGNLNKVYSPGGAAAYNQALGLLGVGGQPTVDPATGAQTPASGQPAFQNYLDSTGYRTQMKSGIDALNSNAAARGMLKSGATLKATQRFGAGLGQQYFNNYIGQLMGSANMGLSADQSLANVYTGNASQAAGALQQGYNGAAMGNATADATQNIAGAIAYQNRQPPAPQPVK